MWDIRQRKPLEEPSYEGALKSTTIAIAGIRGERLCVSHDYSHILYVKHLVRDIIALDLSIILKNSFLWSGR